MANVFAYTGYRRVYYFKYLDIRAGHTLVADPGQQYEIQATESDITVPPRDGLWSLVVPLSLKNAPPLAVMETSAPNLTLISEMNSEEFKAAIETDDPESSAETDSESESKLDPESEDDVAESVKDIKSSNDDA